MGLVLGLGWGWGWVGVGSELGLCWGWVVVGFFSYILYFGLQSISMGGWVVKFNYIATPSVYH